MGICLSIIHHISDVLYADKKGQRVHVKEHKALQVLKTNTLVKVKAWQPESIMFPDLWSPQCKSSDPLFYRMKWLTLPDHNKENGLLPKGKQILIS